MAGMGVYNGPGWAVVKREAVYVGSFKDYQGNIGAFFIGLGTFQGIGPLDTQEFPPPHQGLPAPKVGKLPSLEIGDTGALEFYGAGPDNRNPLLGSFLSFQKKGNSSESLKVDLVAPPLFWGVLAEQSQWREKVLELKKIKGGDLEHAQYYEFLKGLAVTGNVDLLKSQLKKAAGKIGLESCLQLLLEAGGIETGKEAFRLCSDKDQKGRLFHWWNTLVSAKEDGKDWKKALPALVEKEPGPSAKKNPFAKDFGRRMEHAPRQPLFGPFRLHAPHPLQYLLKHESDVAKRLIDAWPDG